MLDTVSLPRPREEKVNSGGQGDNTIATNRVLSFLISLSKANIIFDVFSRKY